MSPLGRIALALSCVGLLFALSYAQPAAAQLTTNKYNIDLFTGPVLGPGRIVGMGGAHVAIAAGIDGAAYNPAGYAERAENEIDFFAFDINGGLWFSGFFRNNDFDNNRSNNLSSTDTLQLTLATRMQFSDFGIGSSGLLRIYALKDKNKKTISEVRLLTVRAGGGYAFLDGSLVLGGALVMAAFDVSKTDSNRALVTFLGLGAEVGALLRPKRERYRLGVVARTPIKSKAKNDQGVIGDDQLRRAEGFVLPSEVYVPWEIDVGFAYQFGERRTNVPWRNTHTLSRELREQIRSGSYQAPQTYGEAPYPVLPADLDHAVEAAIENYREGERRLRRHQPRRYVLLAVDLLIYGQTPRGQSLSGFLRQVPERSGERIAYGLRVGAESEILQDRMRLRLGSYVEPSRLRAKYYRVHGTLGIETRLFDFWGWSASLTATIDVAYKYFNWGLSVGLWW